MVGSALRETLIESSFGEIEYYVVFRTLECTRTDFSVGDGSAADLPAIEGYGCALRVVNKIVQHSGWVLTKDRFLVWTETSKSVPGLVLNVNLDENVDALVKYDIESIRPGVAIPIDRIDGLDANVGKRPWYWCVFK